MEHSRGSSTGGGEGGAGGGGGNTFVFTFFSSPLRPRREGH